MSDKKMPGVIGLAFISPQAVEVVLNQDKWEHEYCPSERFSKWVRSDHERKTVALLTDKASFQTALNSGVDRIVAFCPWTWLQARGIMVLDAQAKGHGLVVQRTIEAHVLQHHLTTCEPYEPSAVDKWLARGAPKPDPSRETCPPNKLYRTYSLANLIHLALGKTDEALMMVKPRDFWVATYQFAVGKLSRKQWLARYARSLKTAGAARQDLQAITKWIKRYAPSLTAGKAIGAVSSIDVALSRKLTR